jgi:hypothetical protein
MCCLLLKKKSAEMRSACVGFLPANEQKKKRGGHVEQKQQEKRSVLQRNLFSFTTLIINFLLNSLERTKEGGRRNTIRALTEKEERSPHFRERAVVVSIRVFIVWEFLSKRFWKNALFFFSSLIRADRDRKKESSDVRTVHPTEIVAIFVRYMRRDTDFKEKMVLRRVRRLRHLRQLPPDAKRAAVEKNE